MTGFSSKTNFPVQFLGIYVDLMSHHVPDPPGCDVVMTEQVSGPKEPKLLGRHMPSIPYDFLFNFGLGLGTWTQACQFSLN